MKKTLSLLLSLIMICSIFTISFVSAAASTNGHSQAEAVEWIKARGNENWWQDVDGAYDCQCVDLTMAYYSYLGKSMSGYAKDYLNTSKLPSGWWMDETPEPGAIIVWGGNTWTGQWTTGENGHVGLVYAVSGSNVYTVETNTGGTNGQGSAASAQFRTRVNCNAKFIHPDFSGSSGNGIIRWGNDVNETITITESRKFWFKRIDDDSNYYINVYLDDQIVLNHIQADSSNLVSYNVDISSIRNGNHALRAELYNSVGKYEDTISFISENCIDFWSISNTDNSSLNIDLSGVPNLSNQVKFWFKRTNSDSNHYFNIYVDGSKVADHISAGNDSLVSCVLDTKQLTNDIHSIVCEYTFTNGSSTTTKYFNVNNSQNPIGNVDVAEGKCGALFVQGWAFDPSDTSQPLDIHIYIGGDFDESGSDGHSIKANFKRSDVNNAYNCGENHGFDSVIGTSKTGSQTVYIYAINIGDGSNILLLTKTVYINQGHSWGTPTYTWSSDNKTCTATRVCSRDSSHTETETVNTTSTVIKQPTTTATGTRKFTATFSNSAFTTQTKNVSIPKLTDDDINFPDVTKGAWYYDAVQYCAKKGYVSGYQSGKFGPGDNLKRQDFVMILARIAGANLDSYKNKTSKFSDVKKGAYYFAAVNWAVANNIISGYENGKFGVNDPITREQVATILYRYKKSPSVSNVSSTLSSFSDRNAVSSYAKTPMAWAVQNGVIGGTSDGRLAPTKSASRAEIATIIMRMDQKGMF